MAEKLKNWPLVGIKVPLAPVPFGLAVHCKNLEIGPFGIEVFLNIDPRAHFGKVLERTYDPSSVIVGSPLGYCPIRPLLEALQTSELGAGPIAESHRLLKYTSVFLTFGLDKEVFLWKRSDHIVQPNYG